MDTQRILKGRLLFDFVGQDESELTDEQLDGWTFCKLARQLAQCGYVPSKYIQIIRGAGAPPPSASTPPVVQPSHSMRSTPVTPTFGPRGVPAGMPPSFPGGRSRGRATPFAGLAMPALPARTTAPARGVARGGARGVPGRSFAMPGMGMPMVGRARGSKSPHAVSPGMMTASLPVGAGRATHQMHPMMRGMSPVSPRDRPAVAVAHSPMAGSSSPMAGSPPKEHQHHRAESIPIDLARHGPSMRRMIGYTRSFMMYLRMKRWVGQKRFRKLKNRLLNMRECVSTEETYLKQLTFCVDEIKNPIKETGILDPAEIRTLFSDIEQVRNISKNLFADIDASHIKFPSFQLGQCFKTISPFFKMYKTYINNYDAAIKSLEKLKRKNSKFAVFLQAAQKKTPQFCRGYKLEDFLILPIQRIPRYKMLLDNVHKLTPEDHLEKSTLKDALDTVSEVAMFVNFAKKEKAHTQSAIKLAETLKGQYDTLIQPSRHYVAETACRVRCPSRGVKGFSKYRAYLFNDLLILQEGSKMLKSAKAILLFLHFAHVSQKSKVIIVDCLSRGGALQVEIGKLSEQAKWYGMVKDQIEGTLAAIRSRGHKDVNVADLANRRIVEHATAAQLNEDFVRKKKWMASAAEANMAVLLQLTKFEKDMVTLGDNIDRHTATRDELEAGLAAQEKMKNSVRDQLVVIYQKIEAKDRAFLGSLGNEANAFQEVFNQAPVTRESIPEKTPPKYGIRESSQALPMPE